LWHSKRSFGSLFSFGMFFLALCCVQDMGAKKKERSTQLVTDTGKELFV
jgi:hypothetical protein